jgi:phytoene dehydrogenase-like protein
MRAFTVVGSGVGGSSIAAMLAHQGHDTLLLEKEPYLGGCSSTFTHGRYRYNTGATTFAGYQEGHNVKQLFDAVGFTPDLIETDPTLVVLQGNRTIHRYRDLDRFIDEMDKNHYHPANRSFWELVHTINRYFYALDGHYYSGASVTAKLRSLMSFTPMAWKFRPYIFANARKFITDWFTYISDDYLDFIDAQLLIVAQATSKEVNFLTAALALGYTFNKNHYVIGGMGRLFDGLTSKVNEVKTGCLIERIERRHDAYVLHSKDDVFESRNIVLNGTVYDNRRLFDDTAITGYYGKQESLNNYQSAFVLYMTLKCDKPLEHHYQIISDGVMPHTLSNALFVSLSDQRDNELAPEGHYSVTASIHTDLRWWDTHDKAAYKARKSELQERLIQLICDKIGLDRNEIVTAFSGSPATFRRYINRDQLGGNAITESNMFYKLPANDTPVKGLYQVGDSVYPAQGWPGVVMGVNNLLKVLHG